ncbi:MAG: porin [Polyangiales bacterium]
MTPPAPPDAPQHPPPAPIVPPAPIAPEDPPRARVDYSDGTFYLRSREDHVVMVVGGRAHLDVYAFAGEGIAAYERSNGTGLKPNFLFRRFVLEMGGIIRKKWFYWLGGNFAPSGVDANQAPVHPGNVYDGFVGYLFRPNLRLYFGQYNAPFTMENVTSSRWLDLMERALTVRTLATPYNKADGLMLWGETAHKHLEAQLGGFGGDGMNRPNIDARFDVMARVLVRPLASRSDALQRFHVGGGLRHGRRDADHVRYDAPNLSTPGGYTFWTARHGSGADETHVMPARRQMAFAGEAYLPFARFDLRGEFVYLHEERREALASARDVSVRGGALEGFGSYAQLGIWLAGTPRISGHPAGTYGVLKVPNDIGAQAPYALQLVLRGEALRLSYRSNSRFGASQGRLDARTDAIEVNALQVALNYWATKHVRLTVQHSLYHFPGVPTTDNQALAPGAKSGSAPDARALHEMSFRAGLAL